MQRIQKLQQYLSNIACDALIIEDTINLYYLTGMSLSSGQLLVALDKAVLIVDGRYFEQCRRQSAIPVKLATSDGSTLTELLKHEFSSIKTLGFTSELIHYRRYQALKKMVEGLETSVSLLPLEQPLARLRSIKDAQEIALLKSAAELGSAGFDFICSKLQEGISEIELAIELEIFWKKRGSKGVAFDPIIAFGANSSMPHYRAGQATLKKNDTVLIDIGVNLEHYHSDMTRVLFVGTPHPKILEIYRIVFHAHKAAVEKCRPGIKLGELDQTARSIILEHGYGDYFPHSLGHGVGLEIHEWPLIRNTVPYKDVELQEGMVITIEPGIYLPELGGVRLEDTIVITKEGYESLTSLYTPLVPK